MKNRIWKTIEPFSEKWKRLVGFIILLKLVILAVFSSEYSSGLFQPFLQHFIDQGGNPWQYYYETNLHLDAFPYHGFMLLILAVPSYIIDLFNIESQMGVNFVFKLPLLIADLSIFVILLRLNVRKQNKVILFYLLNPIVFYAIYIHSQLDIIPMALLMVSLYYLLKNKLLYFSIFLGLALSTKLNILIVLPLLLFYLVKIHKLKDSFIYMLIPIGVLVIFDFPFILSTGFQQMVLFNSKQTLLFASYLEIDNLKLLLPVAVLILVYLHFFNQKKVNYDLLSFYFVILFTAAIFFIYPAPAWYIWLVPFVSIYFIQSENLNRTYFLYSLSSVTYLVFFVLFYKSEYKDLLFLGTEVNFKIENEKLADLAFTFMEVTLLALMYAFYKYGIKSNSVYRMKTNLTIGIGGDSGVGKTMLLNNLQHILGDKLLQIEGDGEHKWERGDENWSKFTHLDPKANFIHKQAEAIHELKLGNSIKRSDYDHKTGKFTPLYTLKPKEFIAISGLHSFYLPKLRKIIDLKIYMDTDEALRRHWKIVRDTKKRGYSVEKILEQIETRVSDTKKFIYPQKEFANLIVSYFSLQELIPGDESVKLGLRLTIDASVHIEEILSKINSKYTWDYNDDLKSQFIELREIPEADYNEIALDTIENLDEIVSPRGIWKNGYEGFIQLIALKMMSEYLKDI
jgi:uridine kinase